MDKPNRVPQLYGYTVCLVAVITFLISVTGAVNAVFTLKNPLQGEGYFEQSFSSFEAWQAAGSDRRPFVVPGQAVPVDTTSIETRRTQFNALREERIAAGKFRGQKALTSSGILLFAAVALFSTHWNWLRRRSVADRAA